MDSPLIVPTAPRLTDTKDSEEVRKSLLDFAAKVNETIISERRAFTEQLGNTDDPYFIMYDDADAHTFPLPENAPLKTTYSFMRTVASTNSITVTTSGGETVEGATSFVTHGATATATLNNQIVRITKTGATTWEFTEGVISGENSNGRWIKFGDGTMIEMQSIFITIASGSISNNGIGSYGWSFYYGDGSWVFPVAFYASPIIASSAADSSPTVTVISSSSVSIRLRAIGTSDKQTLLIAIGRWKA